MGWSILFLFLVTSQTVEAVKASESGLRLEILEAQRTVDVQRAENLQLLTTVDILNKEKQVLYTKLEQSKSELNKGGQTKSRYGGKVYEPEKFSDHVTDIMQQNDKLRHKVCAHWTEFIPLLNENEKVVFSSYQKSLAPKMDNTLLFSQRFETVTYIIIQVELRKHSFKML